MRSCRACGRRFRPLKLYYYWCSWACRQADDEASGSAPDDIWQAAYDAGYRDGFTDGQAHAQPHTSMPLPIWRGLLRLVHPDLG